MLQPVRDPSVLAAAGALVAGAQAQEQDAPQTWEAIRANHDRELAAMTPTQLAVVARERQAARAGCMRTVSSDDHLDRVCRFEAHVLQLARGRQGVRSTPIPLEIVERLVGTVGEKAMATAQARGANFLPMATLHTLPDRFVAEIAFAAPLGPERQDALAVLLGVAPRSSAQPRTAVRSSQSA